eukprot:2701697-Prymnesium_polylepis.1
MEEKLWAGTPPIFVRNTGPLNDVVLPKLDDDEFSTGESGASTAIVAGLAPERIVQKICQSPLDRDMQVHGCALLTELFVNNAGACLGAANARAVPVLVRMLRSHGQDADVQLAAWRPLLAMLNAQPFLRKVVVDGGGMNMLLAGFSAHVKHAEVVTLLCLVLRSLLPATPPRPLIEAGGLELLSEAYFHHATNPAVGE